METDDRVKLYCSFCGKEKGETKRLIAGPGVYICNECVERCATAMLRGPMPAQDIHRLVGNSSRWYSCSFCGKMHNEVDAIVYSNRHIAAGPFICSECIDVCVHTNEGSPVNARLVELARRIAELDARNAPQGAYRELMSTGSKNGRIRNWRKRVLRWLEYEKRLERER